MRVNWDSLIAEVSFNEYCKIRVCLVETDRGFDELFAVEVNDHNGEGLWTILQFFSSFEGAENYVKGFLEMHSKHWF